MSELFRRFRFLLSRRRFDRELQSEMEAHREMAGQQGAGQFGNTLQLREQARDAWGWTWIERFSQDISYAARKLRKSPGFTLPAIMMLAIGIGVNVAAFGFFNLIVLQPLAVRDPATLFRFQRLSPQNYANAFPYPEMAFFREHSKTLTILGVSPGRLTIDGEPRSIKASFVTAPLFTELGAVPKLGRTLVPGDDISGAEHVVVLGFAFWQRHFAADPLIVGKTIRLNGKPAPAEYGLNVEWDVKPQTLGRFANLNFEWDDSDETITLSQNRSKAALAHFGAGTWTAITPVTTPNGLGTRHSIAKKNWNQFSPFGVFVYLINLPIELQSFTAKESNGRGLLNWSTASEANNAGFDVEKSLDGVQFDKIGFVKGFGTTNLVQNYNFTDNNLTQTTYYRLKQLDNDDKFQYSPIVSILSKSEKKTFKAYPNPMNAELTIEANIGGEAQLDILDVTGKVVLSQSINNGIVNISTQSLVRGTYFARILTESEVLIQKIIKN